MSEFKGTPGPWSVEGSWVESDCKYIAEVHDFREECEIFKPVHPESAANANLIAAAPELLEALQLIIKDLRTRAKVRGDIDDDGTVVLDIGSGVLMKANDAISKALGQ